MPGDAPGGDLFEGRLRDALRREVQRNAIHVTAERLRAAASAPPDSWRPRRWWPVAAVATAAVCLLVVLRVLTNLPVPNGLVPQASGPARSSTQGIVAPIPAPITLADCRIEPAGSPLAFSGWATTAVLDVSGGAAEPGQPVYALITAGPAEWMGWRTAGAEPIYPAPIGRMGCIFDPSTGRASVVGVRPEWRPPDFVDGCPASPEDEFAGYREIGGPRAWALLPTGTSGWMGADGSPATILYRLGPPPGPGQRVVARAEALDGSGERVDGTASGPVGPSSAALGASPSAGSAYYTVVEQSFPHSGCWVLNVTVDGQLAGSAIISVAATPGA